MGNTFGAHIFKRRTRGEREEVTIKLFKMDGSPLNLSGETEVDPDAPKPMFFRGNWNALTDYKKNDVVLYNSGDGAKTYIFNEDHSAAVPTILDVNGFPITKLWDPLVGQVDLVLGPDSHVGGGGYAPGSRYDLFAIKVNASGALLSLRAVDILGLAQDLGGVLWHLKADNTWEPVTSDDDGAGSGHPWIRYNVPGTHVMPGIYAFALSRYSTGMAEAAAAGTSRVTLGGDNTAVIGSFSDFPLVKATRLG
jgi:hypothetical protein